MVFPGPPADSVGDALTCSRAACRNDATWGMLWNNPKIHTPERRKVWLTCDNHHEYFRSYLTTRNFLKQEVPVQELEHLPRSEFD